MTISQIFVVFCSNVNNREKAILVHCALAHVGSDMLSFPLLQYLHFLNIFTLYYILVIKGGGPFLSDFSLK